MTRNTVPTSQPAAQRRRMDVRGRVQGVGFRPFVFRLAGDLELTGFVGNDAGGAFIEVQGSAEDLDIFQQRLQSELPPIASISELHVEDQAAREEKSFRIAASSNGQVQEAEITPDVATCKDCLRELNDPHDRRHRYPFINCTNCGPRYSIIQAVPYDRPNTTMHKFTMCPACQAEYEHPADRRFHAQPNACPVCGPQIWLADQKGRELPGDPLRACAQLLNNNYIVAVKGLGGFHLACRANSRQAVMKLRERKNREAKPLAVMVDSLATAKKIGRIDQTAADLLTSPQCPIVLVEKQPWPPISRQVAPDTDTVGLMLPYTPLHHLLFAEGCGPLIMTSGNPSEEPLCSDNDEALQRLAHIADAFLLHDRDIERKVDDSVVLAHVHRLLPIRRARGYVPEPLSLDFKSPRPVLAVGGELKSTVCMFAGCEVVLSEHLGELSNAKAYRNFSETVEQFKKLLRVKPEVVACDLHPDYASTRYAHKLGLPVFGIQHHHAHIVACMAENNLTGEVIGLSCDGTGYGTDGAIWGCEALVCDRAEFQRVGHLRYYPLFGGDAAASQTWRPAAALMREAFGEGWQSAGETIFQDVPEEALRIFEQKAAGAGSMPLTSSLGRLFDAVAFLTRVCTDNHYEGQAAVTLEAWGRKHEMNRPFDYNILRNGEPDDPLIMDVRPTIRDLVGRIRESEPVNDLAWAFHETVAAMLAETALEVSRRTGLKRVLLSGGCFLNRLLVDMLQQRFVDAGCEVYVHSRVPPGDGGLALGQAVAAAERLRR
jgi:hydrogenase maturation protein HypF